MKVDNLPLLANFEGPCSKILQLLAKNLLNYTNNKRDFVTEKAFRQGHVGLSPDPALAINPTH